MLPQAILALCYHSHIYINQLWFSGLRDMYTDRLCCGSITEEILMNFAWIGIAHSSDLHILLTTHKQ